VLSYCTDISASPACFVKFDLLTELPKGIYAFKFIPELLFKEQDFKPTASMISKIRSVLILWHYLPSLRVTAERENPWRV
jgi:hypothetical protein